MRKLSKKGAVMFGGVLAVCAFGVPSMSSAASWGPVSTEHTLTATNLSFTVHTPVASFGWSCRDWQLTVDVRSAAVLTITNSQVNNCAGTGALAAGCTVTSSGTNFYWTATGPATNNVQIHGVDIDLFFENTPNVTSCTIPIQGVRLTGTLTGANWTASNHDMDLPSNAAGLVAHFSFGTFPFTMGGGTIVDRQQTLTLI